MKSLLLCLQGIILFAALSIPQCEHIPAPGEVDPAMPETRVGGGHHFLAMASQPDGKFLVGGRFREIRGELHTHIARFNADGSLDSHFGPLVGPAAGDQISTVETILVQPDGKILLGGRFKQVEGEICNNIARLNPNGTLDTTFAYGAATGFPERPDSSPEVHCLCLLPNGQILAAGSFKQAGHLLRRSVARLNTDGTPDPAFDSPVLDPPVTVYDLMTLDAAGNILLLGFSLGEGDKLIRLHPDGSPYLFPTDLLPAPYHTAVSLAVAPDGSFVMGTYFGLRRVTADGTPDESFAAGLFGPDPSPNYVRSIAFQQDGKLLIAGDFESAGGQPRLGLARLHADGTLDESFVPAIPADKRGHTVAIRENGHILAFVQGVQSGDYLVQVIGTPVSQRLEAVGPGEVAWTRGGTLPLLSGIAFEVSVDRENWTLLGPGVAVADNRWVLTGLTLPEAGWLRARGRMGSGKTEGNTYSQVDQIVHFPMETFPPDTPIVSGPAGENALGTAVFVFSSDEPVARYTYSFDGAPPLETTIDTVFLPVASPGPHRLTVFATDLSENADPTPAVREWIAGGGAAPDGTADTTFVQTTAAPVIDGPVTRLAVQPDGKIIATGNFTEVEGQVRLGLARFLPNGAVEGLNTFDPGIISGNEIAALAVQPDGKIVITGSFISWNGSPRGGIARLLPNGDLDPDFATGTGANSRVYAVLVLPDRKLIIGGNFTTVHGEPRANIARLNENGTLDTTFTANVDAGVFALALQPNGGILIAGVFSNVDDTYASGGLARLMAEGTHDLSFTSPLQPGSYPSSLAVQRDGNILVGGYLRQGGGFSSKGLMRLLPNGTEEGDMTFHPDAVSQINEIVLQQDGRIILGGGFYTVGEQPRNGLARLKRGGTLETTLEFNTDLGVRSGESNGIVNAVVLQRDGKIVLGGDFTEVSGGTFRNLARLRNGVSFSEIVAHCEHRAEWLVGGTAPDVQDVRFQISCGDDCWEDYGPAQRTAGGWEITGVSLPATGQLRALGRTATRTGNAGLISKGLLLAPALEMWREHHFGGVAGNPQIAGNDADPDNDSIPNIMEYGGGTDPRDPRSHPRITGAFANGALTFTWPRAVAATDIAVAVECSADLTTWAAAPGTEEVIADNGVIRTIRVTIPFNIHDDARPREYLRATVTPLP